MVTSSEALTNVRRVCQPLPGVTEEDHFGERCFRVGKKIFASCGEKDGKCRIVLQMVPADAARFVRNDPRFRPYSRQKNCVEINADDVTDWTELQVYILGSYMLNMPSKPKKKPAPKYPSRKKKK